MLTADRDKDNVRTFKNFFLVISQLILLEGTKESNPHALNLNAENCILPQLFVFSRAANDEHPLNVIFTRSGNHKGVACDGGKVIGPIQFGVGANNQISRSSDSGQSGR